MIGAMSSEWQAASAAVTRRWEGLRFGGMGEEAVVKKAVCPESHRKTSGERIILDVIKSRFSTLVKHLTVW